MVEGLSCLTATPPEVTIASLNGRKLAISTFKFFKRETSLSLSSLVIWLTGLFEGIATSLTTIGIKTRGSKSANEF